MSLRDHDSGRSPNYLDAEKVVELLHVLHLELVGEEELDLIDFDEMLTPNDKIITYMMMIGLAESLRM